MKKFIINLDYTDLDYNGKNIFFFSEGKLIHEATLYNQIPDPTDDSKSIPLPEPHIFTVELEIEDCSNITLCLEENNVEAAQWGEDVWDLMFDNLLFAFGAVFIFLKGHFDSFYMQRCYWLVKRYRLISKENATFNLKFIHQTRKLPIANMKCGASVGAYMESFYRPCNFQKDYELYKKSVILDTFIVFSFAILAIITGLILNVYHYAAYTAILFGLSALIFFFRNSLISKKQFIKLRDSNWNLDVFASKENFK